MTKVETFIDGFHDNEAVQKMEYSELGNTGMHVSRIGFGTSKAGVKFGGMESKQFYKTVEFAVKSGINFIDISPWYGNGKAEENLGEAFRRKNIPRKAYYLASKVGRYEKQIDKMFDFSAERVTKSIDESLQRLGVEYLDLVQVQDMEFAPSLDIIVNETLPALQKAKDAGKVRFIGITGYPLENFKTVLEKSTVRIDTVLSSCRYCLNNTSLLDYIPYLKSKGVGIINADPMCFELLSNDAAQYRPPIPSEIQEACDNASYFARDMRQDISDMALKFSTSNTGIDTTIVSTTESLKLTKYIDAVLNPLPDEELLAMIRERYFIPLNNMNWENAEIEIYKNAMKKIENGEKLRLRDNLGP